MIMGFNRMLVYRDELAMLYKTFNSQPFTYNDASKLHGYSYKAHRSLLHDGSIFIKHGGRTRPQQYTLSDGVIKFARDRLKVDE